MFDDWTMRIIGAVICSGFVAAAIFNGIMALTLNPFLAIMGGIIGFVIIIIVAGFIINQLMKEQQLSDQRAFFNPTIQDQSNQYSQPQNAYSYDYNIGYQYPMYQEKNCSICCLSLKYIEKYDRYYCNNCEKYE
ncbi:MAG: hypothetical protein KAJ51_07130 [Thermoplasmata archaeon]|nr:hypothetical protein [Thermoplasmata archaeon]